MTIAVWVRCFLVSLLFALTFPAISTLIVVPREGEEVLDLRALDSERINELSSEEELSEYVLSTPTRRLSGFERFTYAFTHPQFFYFYIRGVAVFFFWALAATAVASYLNLRAHK